MKRVSLFALMTALCLLGAVNFASAQAPDAVEGFTAFTTLDGTSPLVSPSDVGPDYFVVDFGYGGTVAGGFVDEAPSLNGDGLAFSAAEDTWLVLTDNVSTPTFTTRAYQVAFWVNFSSVAGTGNRTQTFLCYNQDAADMAWMIRTGTDGSGTLGIGLTVPVTAGSVSSTTNIPATAGDWHQVVVQYDSPTSSGATDGAVAVWVDPASGGAAADIASGGGFTANLGGPGDGPFGYFGFAAALFGANPSSPDVRLDSIGVWDDFGTVGVNDLQAAIDFLNAQAIAKVNDWQQLRY